jgi:hypothetical protein
MSSGDSMKSQKWRASTPLWALLLLTLITWGVLWLLGPLSEPSFGVVGPFSGYADEPRNRFSAAALAWAALAVPLLAALAAAVVAGHVVVLAATRDRPRKARARTFFFIVAAAFAFFLFLLDYTPSVQSKSLSAHGFLRASIAWFTTPANVLTGWAIASLFVGAAAVLLDHTSRQGSGDEHVGTMQTLLALGTIATVLGVLEIGALNRMSASATQHGANWAATRATLTGQLSAMLSEEAKAVSLEKPDASKGSLMDQWFSQTLGDGIAENTRLAIGGRAYAHLDTRSGPKEPTLRHEIVSGLIAKADKGDREALAGWSDRFAAHTASFWGAVFTTALALMYLPTAFILARNASAGAKQSLAVGIAGGEGTVSDKVLKPFFRLLATLAPLLVGAIADALRAGAAGNG